MPFPLTSHHVQLVSACYPPPAALLTAAPEYKPNSQELSRLTYYASNRPGKITKLSTEVQKRAISDARKARTGNTKARATLLVSLNIFKALVTECRRNLSLLSAALISSLDAVLEALPDDLEVAAKAATVFIAWTTYSSGNVLAVDQILSKDFMSTLRRFASMCVVKVKRNDFEVRNRTRLIGLAAVTGAVTSEVLYNSSMQYKMQVPVIIPALLPNLLHTEVSVLSREATSSSELPLPLTPYLSDFRSRPLLERRAASIHMHMDGDNGPSMDDVANAALHAFACLLSQSNGTQVESALQAVFDSLGLQGSWHNVELCCWLVQKAVEWIQYQYRFAVPMRLVEQLLAAQDDPRPSELHRALTAMIKTVFMSSTPLANVSTSDVCSNITSVILRRVAINPQDGLLPALVDCVGALGTHICYADQVHDLACEIIGRLINIESSGVSGRDRIYGKKFEERSMALRCLLASLKKLILSSNGLSTKQSTRSDKSEEMIETSSANSFNAAATGGPKTSGISNSAKVTLLQRNRIPPDVWQETLSLLCDETFEVRSDYMCTLISYLKTEMGQDEGSHFEGMAQNNAVKRTKKLHDNHHQHTQSVKSLPPGDNNISRFLNILYASLYALATSSRLGLPPSSPPSPVHSIDGDQDNEQEQEQEGVRINVTPSTPMHDEPSSSTQEDVGPDYSQGSQSSRRKSLTMSPQARKVNKLERILNAAKQPPSKSTLASEAYSACLSDYLHMSKVLGLTYKQAPSCALLTGVPMLIALAIWCEKYCTSEYRRNAIHKLIVHQWQTISQIWNCPELRAILVEAGYEQSPLPEVKNELDFPQTEEALPLTHLSLETDVTHKRINAEEAIGSLAKNKNIQLATSLDESTLKKRLSIAWNPENALHDSTEQTTTGDAAREGHMNPVLKISPALMHISNLSLQSLARSNRGGVGVGVSDLRDALEGRAGTSNIALSQDKAPSVSSVSGVTYSAGSGESTATSPSTMRVNRPKLRGVDGENPSEVRDVLDKLGIGAKNGANLLKVSFSGRQRANTRTMLIPPYKN